MRDLSGCDKKQLLAREKTEKLLGNLPRIFSEYVTYLKTENKADSTIFTYLDRLSYCCKSICQSLCLTDEKFYAKITNADIANYFEAKSNLGDKSLRLYSVVLKSFFVFLIKNKYLVNNPMPVIRQPIDTCGYRKINYLTQEQLNRLLITIKHNKRRFVAFRDEVMFKLAISTGLNIAEIVNLNVQDIDFTNGVFHVKSNRGERSVHIGDYIQCLLETWCEFRNEYVQVSNMPALFFSSENERLTESAVNEALAQYCEQADLPLITCRDLKSTMIYLLACEGVSMEALMRHLGTQHYHLVAQAYDAARKEHNVNILDAANHWFDSRVLTKENVTSSEQRTFSVEIKKPDCGEYTSDDDGFTIIGNIVNSTEYYSKYVFRESDSWDAWSEERWNEIGK